MAIKVSGTTVIDGSRNIVNIGNVDGRDVSVDGAKLDDIEAGADVTDTTNVTAAGALMDSELTNITAVKALDQGVATTDSPSFVTVTATGTGAIKVPAGTEAQRPTPATGQLRFNTDAATFEGYDGTEWGAIGGGGGNTVSIIASGSIAAGQPVVLKSDGTVTVPQLTSQSIGTPQIYESGNVSFQAVTFDPVQNKVVVFYNDNSSGYAVVGTVSGTSITFGARVQFNAGDAFYVRAVYDSNAGKVVASFRDAGNGNRATVIVGTVSGSTISFGAETTYTSTIIFSLSVAYDSIDSKYLFTYTASNNSIRGRAATLSGDTWTFGAEVTIFSGEGQRVASVSIAASTFLICFRRNVDSLGVFYSLSVSGTSVSVVGSAFLETMIDGPETSLVYDSFSKKAILAYTNAANDGKCVTASDVGASITVGTPTLFNDGNTDDVAAVFDSNANKVVISFRDQSSGNYGTLIAGSVSGDSVVFESPVIFRSSPISSTASTFDSVSNKVIVAYGDDNPSNDGTAIVFQNESTDLNSFNYVGLSDAAYSDGQSAVVQVVGSVNNQNSGLIVGQPFYVQANGGLSQSTGSLNEVYAGLAISSTEILVKG